MSKNAQRNQHVPFVKQSNQVSIGKISNTCLKSHPTKFGCIAYITGFDLHDQHYVRQTKFVPVIRKSEAVPAWKSPTLRSSHTL